MNRNWFILRIPIKWMNQSGSSLLINLQWKNKWNVCQPQDSLSVLGGKVTKLCVIMRDRILGPWGFCPTSSPCPVEALPLHSLRLPLGSSLQNNSMCGPIGTFHPSNRRDWLPDSHRTWIPPFTAKEMPSAGFPYRGSTRTFFSCWLLCEKIMGLELW